MKSKHFSNALMAAIAFTLGVSKLLPVSQTGPQNHRIRPAKTFCQ